NWATVAGTATAGSDFIAASGTVLFVLGGVMTRRIQLSIVGDNVPEPTETFTVQLSSPANATLATSTATVTNVTDDIPPHASIAGGTVSEGTNGTTTAATFTVTLSFAPMTPVTLSWSTADGTATAASGDYIAASGTLPFAPGQTSKNISVTVNGDTLFEPNETFTVTLSNPVGATIATATGTG